MFLEASHHSGSLMTLLQRKDLENEMTCGEGGHRGAMRHQTRDGEAILDFQPRWASSPSCHLTAPGSKGGQQKNHPAKPRQPTKA